MPKTDLKESIKKITQGAHLTTEFDAITKNNAHKYESVQVD